MRTKTTVHTSSTIARITENDPSAFVEGVNMITGDLYLNEEDYAVQGAEPIRLGHFYISSTGKMKGYSHLFCYFDQRANCFCIEEPNGSVLYYLPDGHKRHPEIGDEFYGNHPSLRYSAVESPGISNTASGNISARTNRKNQFVLLNSASDAKGKSFTLVVADGTRRRYVNIEDQIKGERNYHYKLVSEELPNGHVISYGWEKNTPLWIRSGSRNKTFASISLIPTKNQKDQSATIKGSDGRTFSFKSKEINGWPAFDFITTPDFPTQTFHWVERQMNGIKIPFLSRISSPNGRLLSFDYDENNLIKSLSTPIGISHSFFYDIQNRNSYVIDAKGHKTRYYWDENYRLTQINRFEWEDKLVNSERFVWDKSELASKSLLDSKQNVVRTIAYSYDEFGNIEEETFQGNLSGEGKDEKYVKKMDYANDARHLLLKESHPNGLSITYTYWRKTNLLESKTFWDGDKDKIRYSYAYNDDYILIRETIDGQSIKEIIPVKEGPFVGMPEVITEKSSDGKLLKKTILHYRKGALVEKKDIYDANDTLRYSLTFTYDDKGRLETETNAIGQVAKYNYDDNGNRISCKDFSGRLETKFKYDLLNRPYEKEEIGSDGVHQIFTYVYDGKNHLIEEIDDRENATTYEYDPLGNRIKTTLPLDSVIKQAYDAAGNEIETVDPEGHVTTTDYNAYGKPILKIHPDETQEKWSYYLDGTLKTHTDQKGIVTTFEYDYLGRIKSKKIAGCEEVYEYEGLNLVSKTDYEGYKTIYGYDLAGRKISEECCGEKVLYGYDSMGRLSTVQEGDLVTIKEYDLLDRVVEERKVSVTQELLRKEEYEYDLTGNRSAIIREGYKEKYDYDSVGRLIKKTDALQHSETVTYEKEDHNLRKTHTDSMGLKTIEIFNVQNLLISLEKRKGDKKLSLEEKSYYLNGLLKTQTNTISSKIIKTRWKYDSRGRLDTLIEAEETPEAKTTQYTYTVRGELEKTIKPDGTIIHREYNDLGHLILLTSSDGTINYILENDNLGRLLKSESINRTVDHFGRILTENGITNDYDTRGRRKSLLLKDKAIIYGYNALDLKKVTWNNKEHNYIKYDLSGRIHEEQLIDGQTLKHFYDPIHKTAISHPAFSQEVLEFDSVGNIRRLRHQNDKIDYTYDDLYQLLSETGPFSHTYLFDNLYNRLQKDNELYQHNSLNQVTSHVQYNLNGNPIRIDDTTLTYDALDRLIRIEKPALIQSFKYDCLNRCVSKTTNGETLYFIHDGQKEIGALDANGNLVEFRVLGNAPHAEIGAAVAIYLQGSTYAPIHDLQGNIAVLLGSEEPTYFRYSAFGEEKISGSAPCPWRFSSKRTDETTGLVYFGRRFYVPVLGRWLTPDPAGYVDGINLYAYVHNDPLVHFDEYGLLEYEPPAHWTHFSWNRSLNPPSPISLNRRDSLSSHPMRSPWYYVNGIKNTRYDSFHGGKELLKTSGNRANIIPLYSESFGSTIKDLTSVYATRNEPNYTSFAIRRLNRNIKWDTMVLDAMNDPRKIFITAFSRGSGDVFHGTKNLTQSERERLIITACGPILTLPRDRGFKVTNLISEGDWCSLFFHPGLEKNPHKYKSFADVYLLPQIDGFTGFNKDHFFTSKTYQDGIKQFQLPDYDTYGGLK